MVDDKDKSQNVPGQGIPNDANDTAGDFAADGSGPRRRPHPVPTIELQATDVTPPAPSRPGADARPGDEDAARAVDAVREAMLSMSARKNASDAQGAADPGHEAGGEGKPEPADTPATKSRPPLLPGGFAFATLEAGAAGGALVLLILSVLWFSGVIRTNDGADSGVTEKIAAFNQRLRDVETRPAPAPQNQNSAALDGLAERLGKLESATASASDKAAAPGDAALASLANTVAQLSRRDDDLAAAVREARGRADAAITAADAAKTNAAHDDFAPLAQRVTALEKTITDQAEAAAKRDAASYRSVRLLFATQALRGALDRGEPYAADLDAVKSLLSTPRDLTALAAFADKGLPFATTLARDLRGRAPAIMAAHVAASTDTAHGGGYLDRLQASAERLVSIRPAGETTADDPRAVVSRAQASADRGDIEAALAELRALPAPMQAPAAAWMQTAGDRAQALAEARRLTADAASALGADSNSAAQPR